jgi:hypothetical protein
MNSRHTDRQIRTDRQRQRKRETEIDSETKTCKVAERQREV